MAKTTGCQPWIYTYENMISHFKRLMGQIFYYGLGDIVSKLAAVIILPLFTRYLTAADFGVASILTLSTVLVSGLADLGLSVSTFRFYPEQKSRDKRRLISTAQILVTLISALIAIVVYFFSQQLSEIFFKTSAYALVLVLAFLSNPLNDWTTAQINRLKLENKVKHLAAIRIAKVITDIVAKIIFVVFLKRGLVGLFEGQLIAAACWALIFTLYTIKATGFGFSWPTLKKMLPFGLPFVFSPIFFGILNWGDRFILGRLTNLSEVGLYTLGYTIGMAVMLPVGAFTTAWPAFYLSVPEPSAKQFFARVLTYFSLLTGYFILLIIIISRDYFVWFTPVQFHSAYTVVPMVAFAYLFLGHYSIMITGTYLKRKTIYIFATEILAVILNIALMFLLIPHLGRLGAAWATLFSYMALPILIYAFTFKIFPIKYEYLRLGQILVALVAAVWLNQQIYAPTVANLIIRLLLSLFFPLLLYLTGFFKERELEFFKTSFKKILRLLAVFFDLSARKLDNRGERLVPHRADDHEVIRHLSSYSFFRFLIASDQEKSSVRPITIVDLGCGAGFGCKMLAALANTEITGIDISAEAISYAKKKYSGTNIKYVQADLIKYIAKMPKFDYVVSRGVFEHIPRGLELVRKSAWRKRLIFDVPYNEPTGPNRFHLITEITEKDFSKFPNGELFYEDLNGMIYNQDTKPSKPNMIICVASSPKMRRIKQSKIKFPLPAWQGKDLK